MLVIDNLLWLWCLTPKSFIRSHFSFFHFQIFCESFLGMDHCFTCAFHLLLQPVQKKPHICVEAADVTSGGNIDLVHLHWDVFLHWRHYRYMLRVRHHANQPWWNTNKSSVQEGRIHLGWIWHIRTLLHLDLLFSCDCARNGAHVTHTAEWQKHSSWMSLYSTQCDCCHLDMDVRMHFSVFPWYHRQDSRDVVRDIRVVRDLCCLVPDAYFPRSPSTGKTTCLVWEPNATMHYNKLHISALFMFCEIKWGGRQLVFLKWQSEIWEVTSEPYCCLQMFVASYRTGIVNLTINLAFTVVCCCFL